MRILDRYIAKRFLITVCFALITFVLIFIIVDLIENLDKFIDHKTGAIVVARYYLNYIPFIVVLTLPVAMLLSTLFSLGVLAKNFELTAMKANGISLYRILAPLFIIGLVVSALVFLVGDGLVAESNRRKSDIKAEYIDKKPKKIKMITSDLFVEGKNGAIYYLKNYDPSTKIGKGVLIQKIKGNRIAESIEAEKIKYIDGLWIAENGVKRVFYGDTTATPNTYEKFDKIVLSEFGEPPEAFEKLKESPDNLTFGELKRYIRLKRKAGKDTAKESVELNLKISFPFINFIIVLLGASLASNPRRSGAALGFAISLTISFIYFTIIRTCQSLGQNHNLSPMLAAWLGNIIFFVIGSVMTFKAHK